MEKNYSNCVQSKYKKKKNRKFCDSYTNISSFHHLPLGRQMDDMNEVDRPLQIKYMTHNKVAPIRWMQTGEYTRPQSGSGLEKKGVTIAESH